jgi:hypothetical protein
VALAQGFRGEAHLDGADAVPLAANTTKIALFRPKRLRRWRKISRYFSALRGKFRYLADQWKINGIFSPINEFCAR